MTGHRTLARTTFTALPPQPSLTAGICSSWPDPDVWHRQGSRTLALALCARCPLLTPCAAWAPAVPASDPAIIGGLTPADRAALRRERQAAAPPPAA